MRGVSQDLRSVKVSGHGAAFSTPDIASFSVTVQETKNTSKEAAEATSVKVASLLKILSDDGAKKG